MKIYELIEKLQKMDKNDTLCSILWTADDILNNDSFYTEYLSHNDISIILNTLEENHDSTYGITWDTIEAEVDNMTNTKKADLLQHLKSTYNQIGLNKDFTNNTFLICGDLVLTQEDDQDFWTIGLTVEINGERYFADLFTGSLLECYNRITGNFLKTDFYEYLSSKLQLPVSEDNNKAIIKALLNSDLKNSLKDILGK